MDFYWIPVLCYFAATVFYMGYLFMNQKSGLRIGFYMVVLGMLTQAASLAALYVRGIPIAGGLDTTLYLFALFITIAFIGSQLKFNAPIIGTFVSPLAFIMTLPHVIVPKGMIEHDPSLMNPWVLVHIVLILLGEALFTVAFISGLLYIFEERKIKSKHVGSFLQKLPSLTTLDRINHICLLVGFPLLTLGLALGLLLAKEIWGEAWVWGQKETWSMATWVLYAVLLHGRLSSGWKGKKAAFGAVLGFGIVLFTLFVIGYISPGQHDFLEY